MDNIELAKACAKTECRKCNPSLKQECLKNACWNNVYPHDNAVPAVFYGVLPPAMPQACRKEVAAWRDRWFENHPNVEKPELPMWMDQWLPSAGGWNEVRVISCELYQMFVYEFDGRLAAEVLDNHYGNLLHIWGPVRADKETQIKDWKKRADKVVRRVVAIS